MGSTDEKVLMNCFVPFRGWVFFDVMGRFARSGQVAPNLSLFSLLSSVTIIRCSAARAARRRVYRPSFHSCALILIHLRHHLLLLSHSHVTTPSFRSTTTCTPICICGNSNTSTDGSCIKQTTTMVQQHRHRQQQRSPRQCLRCSPNEPCAHYTT